MSKFKPFTIEVTTKEAAYILWWVFNVAHLSNLKNIIPKWKKKYLKSGTVDDIWSTIDNNYKPKNFNHEIEVV